jgi:anaerobic magnesium-protoporphyrin IX monomethyl ester cyclase
VAIPIISIKKVLLVKPSGSSGLAFALEPIPLSLEYIAASLIQNVQGFGSSHVLILDMFKEKRDFIFYLKKFNPDIVGITMSATEHYEGLKLVKIVKSYNPNIICIAGGYHPAAVPDIMLNNGFDVVCRTDGELVMVDIIKGTELKDIKGISFTESNRIVHNPLPEQLPELDSYPFPARALRRYKYQNLFLRDRVFDQMMTSRGCHGKCSFCCEPYMSGSKQRFRSPENIFQEIKEIYEYHNRKPLRILIGDPHFLANPKRVDRLCDLLLQANMNITFQVMSRTEPIAHNEKLIKKMVEAGMVSWEIGVESFKQSDLDQTGKALKIETQEQAIKILNKYGAHAGGTFVIGLPQHTREDVLEIARYAKRIGLASAAFGIATPFPKTRFWDELQEQNLIFETDWTKFDENYNVFKHPTMSKQEIEDLRTKCMVLFWNLDTALNQIRLELIRPGRFRQQKPTMIDFFDTIARKMLFGVKAGSSLVETPQNSEPSHSNSSRIEAESEDPGKTKFYDMMDLAFNTWADPRVKEYTQKYPLKSLLELRKFTKFIGSQLIQIVVDDPLTKTCKLSIAIKISKDNRNIEFIDVSKKPYLDYTVLFRINYNAAYYNPAWGPKILLKKFLRSVYKRDFIIDGKWVALKLLLNAAYELILFRIKNRI